LVWEQGHAAPVEQRVAEEVLLPVEERASCRLPNEFSFYTDGCSCGRIVEARGRCRDGVWSESEVVPPAES
jgi:hypothetical protein